MSASLHGPHFSQSTKSACRCQEYGCLGLLHDCFGHEGRGCKAVCLDNFCRGLSIYGSVIERIWCEGGAGMVAATDQGAAYLLR